MENVKIAVWTDEYEDFRKVFPEDVNNAFEEWIEEIEDEEDCIDAERILLLPEHPSFFVGCSRSEALDVLEKEFPHHFNAYEDAFSCCGIEDKVTEVNGKLYLFGCNFGH